MKERLTQYGIIGFSALLMLGVGLLGFQSLSQLSKTNVLDVDETESTSLPYEARIKAGDDYFLAGFFLEAAEEYAYATQLEPDSSAAYIKLSKAYLAAQRPTQAASNAAVAYELENTPQSAAIYGRALLSSFRLEEAETVLMNQTSVSQELSYAKALLTLSKGNHEEAKRLFEEALGQSGTVPPAHIQAFLSAYAAYDSAQGSQSSYLNALLSKAYLDANEVILAENLALETLKQKSDYRDLWMILGYAQLELEKLAEAEDSFKAAKKIDSVKPEIHFLLGKTHFLQSEYEETIDEMELALLYNFTPADEAYKKMAESQTALGRYEEALTSYEAMVNMEPDSVLSFRAPIELALNQVQDLERAKTLAQKGVSLFPDEALSHSLLAQVQLKKAELDLAEASIQTALSLDANLADAHLIAGNILEQQGELEEAKSEYKKAFEFSQSGDDVNLEAAESYNRLMTTPVE